MIEAWFSPEQGQYISLVAFSAFVALLAPSIQKGRFRTAVYATWASFLGIGAILVAVGLLALSLDQPQYVLSPLLSGGVALTLAFGLSFKKVIDAYRQAEYRQVVAQDL